MQTNTTFLRLSLALLCLAAISTLAQAQNPATPADAQSQRLPVTTASAAASRHFENGMVQYENHRWNLALNEWHEAVRLDPKFAQAYAWICLTTTDSAEESSSRAKALESMMLISPGEQYLVAWMADTHQNNYVQGISAMNDLLAMYPQDKRLNFLIGYWLYKQDQYDIAERLTEKALAVDPNYATAWNLMGYVASRRGDLDKAIEDTGKYVKLLPNEPNPHDSYGEMLRLSGRFDEALQQYRNALKIDPTFYISQKELGETYALMGEGEKARAEYAKAIHEAPSDGLKAEYMQKSAMTWLRDGNYDQASKAFLNAAARAHDMEQWMWEARAYRVMAMYEPDRATATRDMEKAEAVLADKRAVMAKSDVDEEEARIWRVSLERAIAAGDLGMARRNLDGLEQMTHGGSISIIRTFQGATGAVLVAEKKYAAAIPHLQEDFTNPVSLRLLLTAYEKRGIKSQDDARVLRKRLTEWRIPSVEEALVVPKLRTQGAAVVSQK